MKYWSFRRCLTCIVVINEDPFILRKVKGQDTGYAFFSALAKNKVMIVCIMTKIE